MGGVQHLFGFDQALSGRRLLMSDKKRDNGLIASRSSLDASNGVVGALKSHSITGDQSLLDFESCKSSKKSGGMPIKTLIAQELSKEPQSRNRTPNLVARLMGLDALPVEQKNGVKEVKASTAELTKCWWHEKQSQEIKSPQLMGQMNAISLMPRASKESLGLKGYEKLDSDWEAQDGKLHLDATAFHSNSRELVARQSRKSRAHMSQSRFKEVEMESADQQSYACEKLNEAELVIDFEDYSGPVYSGSKDTLSESKELLDAVDFLQSNKDLLLKLLQEPNSMFAQYLQDPQSYLRSLSQATDLMKKNNGHKLRNLDPDVPKKEGSKIGLHERDFLDPLCYRSEYKSLRKSSLDSVTGKGTMEDSSVQLLSSEVSPRLFQNHKRQFARIGTNCKTRNIDSQAPTRIVVLKPGPRRTKNHNSSRSFSSSHSYTGFEGKSHDFHDDAENILRELRDRIKAEGKACDREDGKLGLSNLLNGHLRDGLRSPREIAREIARQIRASVTRDLLLDSDRSNTLHSITYETKERNFSHRHCNDLEEIAVSSDGESSTPFRRLSWELQSKPGSNVILPGKYVKHPDAPETHGIKGGRKRVPGRSKPIPVEFAGEKQLQSYLLESQQASVHAKSSYCLAAHDKDNIHGFESQQVHPCIGRVMETNAETSSSHDLDGSIDIPSTRSSKELMDNLPGTLPRSRSVPVSRRFESIQTIKQAENIPEALVEKAVVSPVKMNKRNANVAKQPAAISKSSEYQRANNKVCGASLNSSSDLLVSTNDASDAVDRFEFVCRHAMPVTDSSVEICHMLDRDFTVDKVQVCGDLATHNWKYNNYKVVTTALKNEDNEQQCTQTAAIKDDSNIRDLTPYSSDSSPISPKTVYHLPKESSRSDLEAGKEKLEQPSPVSVLDSLFQEEITSPVSFKGMRSDLHDLHLQLNLLKFDSCERSQLGFEAMSNEGASTLEEGRTEESDTPPQAVSEVESICSHIVTSDDSEAVEIGSIGVAKEDYSVGRSLEMSYLGTVLIASGFSGDSASILKGWHGPNQPLSPCLFQKINDYCCKRHRGIREITKMPNVGNGCIVQVLLSIPDRRLLFDCLNEILVDILGKHLNWHPWVTMPSCNFLMPTGKNLMKLVSMEASRLLCMHSASQGTLESLVGKDLSRGSLWMDHVDGTETVAMEVEKAILNDLIHDTVVSIGKKGSRSGLLRIMPDDFFCPM